MARCPFAQQDPIPGTSTGGSYVSGPFKIVHHTTEIATYAATRTVYGRTGSLPHFTVDSTTIYQHIDTDRAARALKNLSGGVETNRDSAIQIEVVAFAGQPKDRNTLAQVARLCRWIEETHGVPKVWPNGNPRPPRAGRDPGGHNRNAVNWNTQGGHYGHSQVPENTHWDPAYTAEELELIMAIADEDALAREESMSPATPRTLRLGEKVPARSELLTIGPFRGRVPRNSPALTRNSNPDIVFKNDEGNDDDRFMTPRLKEKTDALARLVMQEWPGVKLRVTDAWDEGHGHGATSRHYEGRAADLTTFPVSRARLGRLAGLAVEAGYDWVYYEDSAHIHVSVKREEIAFEEGSMAEDMHDALGITGDEERIAPGEEDRPEIVNELRAHVEELEEEERQLEMTPYALTPEGQKRLQKISADIASLEAAMILLGPVFRR